MSNEQQLYRYPGVTPFTTAQSHIFYGRNEDTAQLLRLIRRQPLSVLYGKSGLGKSSLLNAGIIPEILKKGDYSPIVVRFRAWTEEQTSSPLDSTRLALQQGFEGKTFLSDLLPEENSLWFFAKNRQLNGGGKPLLLFDQFEELFSYPEEAIVAFQREISELLNSDMPLRFERMLETADNLSEEEEDNLEAPLQSRIVFAIRSDRLHLLDRLKDYLPQVLRNTYELKALSMEDARAAIQMPARKEGNFTTDPFEYSEAALSKLLTFLKDPETQRVEGILIQMLCEHYEQKVVAPQALKQLDLPQIGEPETVVKGYYLDKINNLTGIRQSSARILIEEGLVSAGEGMRLSLHQAFIEQEYKVTEELLKQLEDSRLLRSEPFLRGGYTYELSHDRLVPAVIEAREERRKTEEERAREEAAILLKQEAEKERLEKEKAKKQLRQVRGLLIFAVVALLLAVAGLVFAFDQQQEAKEKGQEAINALEKVKLEKEKSDSLYQEKIKADSISLQERFKSIYNEAEAAKAGRNYEKALEKYQFSLAFAQNQDDSTLVEKAIEICMQASDNRKRFNQLMDIGLAQTQQKHYPDAIETYRQAILLRVAPKDVKLKLNDIKNDLQQDIDGKEEIAKAYADFNTPEGNRDAQAFREEAKVLQKLLQRIDQLIADI